MASPMAVAVMTKKALELAEDKRVRTLLASIVAGIVIVMLIPLLVMVSIFNTQAGFSQEVARIVFDGGPIPTDIDAELSKAMEEMMDAFEELDQTIETLEEEGFDDIKVKSFFYILYFTKDMTDFDEEFYEGFVDCFVGEKEDDEIYEELEEYLSYEFTETEKVEIRNLYLFIKYGYSATDKITGIPGEASMMKLLQNSCRKLQNISAFLTNGAEVLRKPALTVPVLYVVYTIPEFITCPEQPHSRFITSVHRCQKTSQARRFGIFYRNISKQQPRNSYWNLCWGQSNVALRRSHRLCKLGEFLLGEAFLWIWQIVKECEKYD